MDAPAAAAPERVLLIRPSALGDVCRSVPVLVSLKRTWPAARVDWLIQDTFVDAIRHHPDLGQAVPFARAELGRQCGRLRFGPLIAWLRALRHARYDLVIDAQGLLRSAVFALATGARRRVGYRNAQELAGLLYNTRGDVDRSRHAVERMLSLAAVAGAAPVDDMRLYAGEDELSQVVLEYPEPYVVLAPTSRWAAKRWPAGRFAALAERLIGAGVERVIVVGGPGEREQCRPILDLADAHPRITDRVGSTTIGMLMALIARSRLVVANDSAAVHIAVGFDRPLVGLYGPTDIGRVGPYARDVDVIQQLSHDDRFDHKNDANARLMDRITIDEVADGCLERIADGACRGPQ